MSLIAPQASPAAKQFIQAALAIIYSAKTAPVLKQMISGSQTLAKGCAPFVAQLVIKLEGKLGPLSPEDEPMVVLHICGAIADMAEKLGDPECKNGTKRPVAQMMTAVKQLISQQQPPDPSQQGQPPLQQMQPGAPQ